MFAALIKDGLTRTMLLKNDLTLHVPDFIFSEFNKHSGTIIKKSRLSSSEMILIIDRLFSDGRIKTHKISEYSAFLDYAGKTTPDINDIHYVALASYLGCPIWSNDRRLKEGPIRVFTTGDISQQL